MNENETTAVAKDDLLPHRATLTVYFPSHEDVREAWAFEALKRARYQVREERGWLVGMLSQVRMRCENGRELEQWSYWEVKEERE